jgi:hypothetical protein
MRALEAGERRRSKWNNRGQPHLSPGSTNSNLRKLRSLANFALLERGNRMTTSEAKNEAKPAVILVGSDKGGVGKTTITRTLLDYYATKKMPRRVYDTEAPRGTLKRFHPDVTEIVDITLIPDQMRVFDTLKASDLTLVDIRAGLLSSTLSVLQDIGFIEAARKSQVSLGVFHILGPSISSLNEIGEVAKFVNGTNYFLVKNMINNTAFFEWDPATYDSYFKKTKGAYQLTIPHLNEMACEQVELASVPFTTFIANKKAGGESASYSFVLRGYVQHWLNNVWSEYDRIRLNEIMEVTSPS